MATIDLDARRAARAEQAGEAPSVVFGGVTFQMPPEMPIEFLELLAGGKVAAALRTLFGPKTDEFLAGSPSMADVTALAEVYGVDPTKR